MGFLSRGFYSVINFDFHPSFTFGKLSDIGADEVKDWISSFALKTWNGGIDAKVHVMAYWPLLAVTPIPLPHDILSRMKAWNFLPTPSTSYELR